jgi:serine/threonine protein kinase
MLPVGASLAGCVIEGVAGRGGMGVVYLARESHPPRRVALKVIAPEMAADSAFRERFQRETDLAGAIEHSNVLPVYRAGEEAGLLYLITRYVDGTDLAALIAAHGRLEPHRAVDVVAQICEGLDGAHARGLVHRDVKPANVLLATEGGREHAYLCDFGLTKRQDATGGPTQTGYFYGTIDYAAPEQFQGARVDARTDVYATGCLLYHALTGSVPFPADSAAAQMYAHLNTPPPSVQACGAGVPVALDAVIAKAMAKAPDERYLSAGDLGRAARVAVAETAAPPRPPFTPPPPPTLDVPAPAETRQPPKRPLLLGVGAVAVVAIGVVVALVLGRSGGKSNDALLHPLENSRVASSDLFAPYSVSDAPPYKAIQYGNGGPGYLWSVGIHVASSTEGRSGGQPGGSIYYNVFTSDTGASSALRADETRDLFVPAGFSDPVSCHAAPDGSATDCWASVGRVEIYATASRGVGAQGDTTQSGPALMKIAIAHLRSVMQNSGAS